MTSPAIPDKWISAVDPADEVAQVARQIIKARLSHVQALMADVAADGAELPGPVHQLRVATRRAAAALRSFEPCLVKERDRRVRRTLRKIRKAAAIVRQSHVHAQLLAANHETATEPERAAIEHMMAETVGQGVASARKLTKCSDRLAAPLGRQTRRLLRSIRQLSFDDWTLHFKHDEPHDGRHAARFHHAADSNLTSLARALLEKTQGDLAEPEALHALRLMGKRLRYAIEIFAACMQPASRDLMYSGLTAMQDRLGAINDQHEMAQRADAIASQLQELLRRGFEMADGRRHETSSVGEFGMLMCAAKLAENWRRTGDRSHQEFLDWWQSADAATVRNELAVLAGRQSESQGKAQSSETPAPVEMVEVVIVSSEERRDPVEDRA